VTVVLIKRLIRPSRYDWNDLLSPVAGIDRKTSTIELAAPYPPTHSDANDPVGGITGGARYWLQNSLDALDAPGEYYLNKTSGELFFVPPLALAADGSELLNPDEVRKRSLVPRLIPNMIILPRQGRDKQCHRETQPRKTLFSQGEAVVSTIDSILTLSGVSHVRFVGLTFESCRGNAVSVTQSGASLQRGFGEQEQHATEPPRFPNDSATTSAQHGVASAAWTDVHVVNCTVFGAGSSGVSFSGGTDSSISGTEVGFAGCKGLDVAGPYVSGERTSWVDGNSIDNCYVHDWSQVLKTSFCGRGVLKPKTINSPRQTRDKHRKR